MKQKTYIMINLAALCSLASSYHVFPVPVTFPTKAGVWPKPQQHSTSSDFLVLNLKYFQFQVTGENCGLLQDALSRYMKIMSMDVDLDVAASDSKAFQSELLLKKDQNFVGFLNKLNVKLMSSCKDVKVPEANMKEEYILVLTSESGENYLTAPSIWGILRGLETFSQLLHQDQDMVTVNATYIYDFPRFPYRGLLVDTARHFITMNKLLITLDAMAYNKMNVFHWHITDNESFPYVSKTYPQLSKKGAFTQKQTYSVSDVQNVIEYAAARGIRVIAEFDSPGHANAFGRGFPELITQCYENETLSKSHAPLDPSKPFTYIFFQNLFTEILSVFKDSYIHLGGDGLEFDCWSTNPPLKKFMKKNNINTYSELQQYHVFKLLGIVQNFNVSPVFWEEVFCNKIVLEKSTILQIWKDPWNETMANITSAGHNVILSAGYYIDYIKPGGDWHKFYNNEPTNFIGSEDQKKLVLGGEACIWTEVVNQYNLESRLWPRTSAAAEKLWSALNADTAANAAGRLEEHTCRMNKRGIAAQPPNGPGFCFV